MPPTYAGKAAWVEVTSRYRIPEWQYDEAADGEPAGVVINLSPTGAVEIREGLSRPEEIDPGTAAQTADSPVAPVKRKASYPQALRSYIAWHKTVAVQEILLANPRKAREVSAVTQLTQFRPHAALRKLAEQPEPQIAYSVIDTHAAMIARRQGLESACEAGIGWQALTHAGCDVDLYGVIRPCPTMNSTGR